MGAWIGDIPPETAAAAAAKRSSGRMSASRTSARLRRVTGTRRTASGRRPAASTSSASTPTTTTGSCCRSRSSTARTSTLDAARGRRACASRRRSTTDAVEIALAELDDAVPGAPRRGRRVGALPARRRVGAAARVRRATRHAVTGVDLAFDVGRAGRRRASRRRRRSRARSPSRSTTSGGSASTASPSPRSAAAPRTRPSARPTGIMDQMAVDARRADAAIFLDCRSLEATVVDLGFAAAGLELLVIDTGVKHSHATGGYGERRASCELGAADHGRAGAARRVGRRPRRARPSSWTT